MVLKSLLADKQAYGSSEAKSADGNCSFEIRESFLLIILRFSQVVIDKHAHGFKKYAQFLTGKRTFGDYFVMKMCSILVGVNNGLL